MARRRPTTQADTLIHTSLVNSLDDLKKPLKKLRKNNQRSTLVILVDSNQHILSDQLDDKQTKQLQVLIEASDFQGQIGENLLDFSVTELCKQVDTDSVLLLGAGDLSTLTAKQLQKLASTLYSTIGKRVDYAAVLLDDCLSTAQFGQFALALMNQSYQFTKYKTKQDKDEAAQPAKKASQLVHIDFVNPKSFADALSFAQATYTGQCVAKDLANEPPNTCYPEYIAEQARKLEKEFPNLIKVTVVNEAKMQKLGMNCFLAVSRGSQREGQLITIEYHGKSKPNYKQTLDDTDKPIVLVGKGVTFDSGGISIKPGAGMEEMKYDMCGAASVFGTMRALCTAELPINVVGALACAENMPAGDACRPSDIVTSMSGQTVEILNTDAEGRLVLCDTLTYVERFQPQTVIDVATLTGACVIALGHIRSAVYSADDSLISELTAAGEQCFDRVWHMPLDDEYNQQLDSNTADMQNIGGRPAGSVTAACFLSRFTQDYRWAHLDIAGTAWHSGKNKAATGRPVPLFMQYLANAVAASDSVD